MNRMIKWMLLLGILAVLLLSATACSRLDVIGQGSITSFDALLSAAPDQVAEDTANAGWSISAPDGAARFIWSGDWGQNPRYDVMLEWDAAPFVAAGLDPAKLPETYEYLGATIRVGVKLGTDAPQGGGDSTPLAAYARIVDHARDIVGYHMSLDHYGVSLGDGNMFEWAKDLKTNDKDMVFVLNPEPLINAGVDPSLVEGWVFAKVEAHMNGRLVEAEKFLKPFELS